MLRPRLPRREVSPSTTRRRQKIHVHAERIVHLSRDMTAFRLYPLMYGHELPSAAFNATSSLLLLYPITLMEIMPFSYARSPIKKELSSSHQALRRLSCGTATQGSLAL